MRKLSLTINLTSKELSVYDAFVTETKRQKKGTSMGVTKTETELIQRAWADGRTYERENLIEVLEHLKKGTSVEAFDAALVLRSLIAVLKDNKIA
jgi:phage I-like protein